MTVTNIYKYHKSQNIFGFAKRLLLVDTKKGHEQWSFVYYELLLAHNNYKQNPGSIVGVVYLKQFWSQSARPCVFCADVSTGLLATVDPKGHLHKTTPRSPLLTSPHFTTNTRVHTEVNILRRGLNWAIHVITFQRVKFNATFYGFCLVMK
jgi:hypothetical protein